MSRSFVILRGCVEECAVNDIGELGSDIGFGIVIGNGGIIDIGAKQVADIAIAEIVNAISAVVIGLVGA